jgi:hypothetical protein
LVVPELRPHVEFNFRTHLGRVTFGHRYRAEARFFHDVLANELVDSYTFSNYRLRYQFAVEVPLLNKAASRPDRLYLRAAEEIMLNAGAKVVHNTFDQNRIDGGAGFWILPTLGVELGYLDQFQQRPSGSAYYDRRILRLTINHRIDLSKRPPPDPPNG